MRRTNNHGTVYTRIIMAEDGGAIAIRIRLLRDHNIRIVCDGNVDRQTAPNENEQFAW